MTFKKPRLLLIYARDFLIYAFLITLLSYYVYTNTGTKALTLIFWFKIITSIAGVLFHQKRKSKELFFYLNNGLGRTALMAMTIALDVSIWLVGIVLLVKLTL